MLDWVDVTLSLHKRIAAVKTPTDNTAIQRQVDATEWQIDRLVHELRELTDDIVPVYHSSRNRLMNVLTAFLIPST